MAYRVDRMRASGYCIHLPDAVVECRNAYRCDTCEVALRILRNTGKVICDHPLFGWRDALPQTPAKKGETWFELPVLLSPEAMRRLGLDEKLQYQVVIAVGGPGVFKKNPCGEIDVLLYADLDRAFTVTRNECYGLPCARACETYDHYFRKVGVMTLCDYFGIKKGEVALD